MPGYYCNFCGSFMESAMPVVQRGEVVCGACGHDAFDPVPAREEDPVSVLDVYKAWPFPTGEKLPL